MARIHRLMLSTTAIAALLCLSPMPGRSQMHSMDSMDSMDSMGSMDSMDSMPTVTSAEDLVGHWQSLACELRPNEQYLTRDFMIMADRWSGSFPNYADPSCSTLNLTFYAAGPYTVGEPSAAIANALEADFGIDTIRLTPHSEGAVGFLNSAEPGTCGTEPWAVHVEQDVTATGCSVLGIDLSEPVVEYEVVLVLDDYLFFGARPLDGSGLESPEKRPTALQIPLVRVVHE